MNTAITECFYTWYQFKNLHSAKRNFQRVQACVQKCPKVSKDFYTFTRMKIEPHLVYSKSEVSEILNIHPRKLNRIAQRHKIEKVDNRYIFKGSFLITLFDLDVSKSVQQVSKDVEGFTPDIEPLLAKIQELEQQVFKLKEELKLYEIADNERLEVFTDDDYNLFTTRLKEWQTQQKDLEQKAIEIQEVKTDAKENIAHYKNLFEYQRKQSDRILEMHEKLIVTIGEQTQSSIQRNHIEAKDKKYL